MNCILFILPMFRYYSSNQGSPSHLSERGEDEAEIYSMLRFSTNFQPLSIRRPIVAWVSKTGSRQRVRGREKEA